jgi:hypothetical protein
MEDLVQDWEIECDQCGEDLYFGRVHQCPVGGNEVTIEKIEPDE